MLRAVLTYIYCVDWQPIKQYTAIFSAGTRCMGKRKAEWGPNGSSYARCDTDLISFWMTPTDDNMRLPITSWRSKCWILFSTGRAAVWRLAAALRRMFRWGTVARREARIPSALRGSTCRSPRGCRIGFRKTFERERSRQIWCERLEIPSKWKTPISIIVPSAKSSQMQSFGDVTFDVLMRRLRTLHFSWQKEIYQKRICPALIVRVIETRKASTTRRNDEP